MKGSDAGQNAAWVGFDWSRERYEDMIGRVIPDYRAQEALLVDIIRETVPDGGRAPFRILELGAGTGSLSRLLLETFPRAQVTALDVSPVMLAACREVLASFEERAQVVEGDFASVELGSGYQAVVSRLAIHHLDDQGKEALVKRVLAALVPGGVFVNSDMIASSDEEENTVLTAEWREHMLSRGDDPDEWVQWLVGDDDFPATEQAQLAWLRGAGFVEAGVVWKRAGFAMFRARRP